MRLVGAVSITTLVSRLSPSTVLLRCLWWKLLCDDSFAEWKTREQTVDLAVQSPRPDSELTCSPKQSSLAVLPIWRINMPQKYFSGCFHTNGLQIVLIVRHHWFTSPVLELTCQLKLSVHRRNLVSYHSFECSKQVLYLAAEQHHVLTQYSF